MVLDRIYQKQITVGVVGLGYVGLPLSLVFAESDVNVLGFDVDLTKIEAIKNKTSYIKHINHGRLSKACESGKFSATNDFSKAALCDAIILCVPTPLDQHLNPDLKYIISTCQSIAPYLKKGVLVSLESTTWPGTTKEVVQPLLEEGSGLKLDDADFYLCFSPEREDPGNKTYHTKNIPKLVGGINPESLQIAVAVYSLAIEHVVPLSDVRVAELAKLYENIFRSVNIALANEMKLICEKLGIDVWEMIQAASTKPFGFMPFWPGPGLGGHCIPIDPFYLTWKAKEFGVRTRFIELAGEINRAMPEYVISRVQECLNFFTKPIRGSRILVFGLAYKSDIDDMRESPSLQLIELLELKGARVEYFDPHLPEIGPNREHPNLIGKKSCAPSVDFDCFLISTRHSCFSSDEILSFGVPIVDTRNFLPKSKLVFQA